MSRRRWGKVAMGVALLVIAAIIVAFATLDRWIFIAVDPGPFDSAKTPPVPDYAQDSSWAALPSTDDDADVFLTEWPAVNRGSAKADVFYVHPTTAVAKRWNAPIDDPDVVKATGRGGTLIQASAFNACCAVYAPRYRQANMKAFVAPNADGDRAIDIAYADIRAAFDDFNTKRGETRPFILAAHSQGTMLVERLVRERIWGKAIAERFVAGYLIGGPVTRDSLGVDVPICYSEDQWGCVVAFNARGPRYQVNEFEFNHRDGSGMNYPRASRICVNPLTWKNDTVAVAAEKNKGALFFDAEKPVVLPAFADATCREGRLLVEHLGEIPKRDPASLILLRVIGPENYHPIEYQLYYGNLRNNAVRRVEAYIAAHRSVP